MMVEVVWRICFPMKILEYSNKDLGRAFSRITYAFHKYFKDVEWVTSNPDIVLVETLGQGEIDYLNTLKSLDNVVLVQQCLFTSGIKLNTWIELWKRCKLVISFHDLQSYTKEKFNFYRTPLGAEPDTFPIGCLERNFKVFSTGHVAETECLDKVYLACKNTNNTMIHTGENFHWDNKYYTFINYLPDKQFSYLLQRVQYVTGLRLVEGFEMACIEGAMTGAVPIIPNLPTYDWYKDFGIYIDVNKDITKQLVDIFSSEYNSLSNEQINYIRNEFSWSNICTNIYKRILGT
jgi:glycosyltransferase involved in cell wall biosynthesis